MNLIKQFIVEGRHEIGLMKSLGYSNRMILIIHLGEFIFQSFIIIVVSLVLNAVALYFTLGLSMNTWLYAILFLINVILLLVLPTIIIFAIIAREVRKEDARLLKVIVLLIIAACSPKPRYGYPTDTLHAMDTLEYDNITDLVLFTYTPQSNVANDRQTVLVNTKTKQQYKFDNPDLFRDGFSAVRYLDNKMIFPDNLGNEYVLYTDEHKKVIVKEIFAAARDRVTLAIDEADNALVTVDMKQREVKKLDFDGNQITTFTYPAIGEYELATGDLLGYFAYNTAVDKLLFFGKIDNKENQLMSLNRTTNAWEQLPSIDKTNEFVQSFTFTHDTYFTYYVEADNVFYFTDLVSKQVTQTVAPMLIPYSAKIRNNELEALHDSSLIFSTFNLEPNNVSVKETYNLNQIVEKGIARANIINVNTPTELVFSTPEGLYRYDKATKELETIIFMDVGNE
jgi:hypothetical protein